MAAVHPLLDEIRELLSAPLAGCSAEQVARHPAGDPARWSAQQVVEHLSATWRMTIAGIEDRLKKGRPLKSRPTLRQRALQVVICDLGYFPKRGSAPQAVQPSQTSSQGHRRRTHHPPQRHPGRHGQHAQPHRAGSARRSRAEPGPARPIERTTMAPLPSRARPASRGADRTCNSAVRRVTGNRSLMVAPEAHRPRVAPTLAIWADSPRRCPPQSAAGAPDCCLSLR